MSSRFRIYMAMGVESFYTTKLSSLITLLKREPDAGKREKGHRVTPFSQLNSGDNYAR